MSVKVVVTRKPGDIVLRVSLGGNHVIGYYCMYRGTREELLQCIETVWGAIRNMPEQPIEPEAHE